MALLSWKVVHDGKTPPPGEVVRPDERMSWGRTTGVGIQHVFAMFGATFVLPPIMGIPGTTAVFFSGIGTLLFLLIVRNRIPSYLGTSAAFIGPTFAVNPDERTSRLRSATSTSSSRRSASDSLCAGRYRMSE